MYKKARTSGCFQLGLCDINTVHKAGSAGLVHLGSCDISTVHSGLGNAISEFRSPVQEFAMELYNFFKHSSSRNEALRYPV